MSNLVLHFQTLNLAQTGVLLNLWLKSSLIFFHKRLIFSFLGWNTTMKHCTISQLKKIVLNGMMQMIDVMVCLHYLIGQDALVNLHHFRLERNTTSCGK